MEHAIAYPKSKSKAEKIVLEANGTKVIYFYFFTILTLVMLSGVFVVQANSASSHWQT